MQRDDFDVITVDFDDLVANTDSNLSDQMYLQDLKRRKLFVTGDVEDSAHEIIHHILQYNKEDKDIPVKDRQPILLYICSVGGSVQDGLAMIDVIKSSKTPVYTINYGYWYSMGFIVGLVGHKRFGTESSTFLCHDGFNMICNSGAKANDVMEFNRRVDDLIKNIVISSTKITEEDYDNNLRKEWYLFADEAKEKGVIDYIIGVDCDIDEVI